MSKNRFHSPFAPYGVIDVVPSADGKSWIKPTIVHAKKYCMRIGVTSTLDVAKDGLSDWKVKQAIFHCMVLPYRGTFDDATHKVNDDEYRDWEDEILNRMKEQVEVYADDGSDVDRELKNYIAGREFKLPDSVLPCADKVKARAEELKVDRIVSGERLASDTLWVTGEPDFLGFRGDKLVWCFDLKRKNKSTFNTTKTDKSLDDNHKLQLGHYLIMLKEHHASDNPQLDILMSCRDNNEAKIIPINSAGRWEEAAYHHNRSWFLRNEWAPWETMKNERARIIADIAMIEEHNKWRIA